MRFDYVDIGTSDFETSLDLVVENSNLNILLVEPIRYYLDRLPNKPNVYKENSAISNIEGILNVNYVPSSVIEQYNLPWWIRGCNSVNSRHPTVDKILIENNLPLDLVVSETCSVITFNQLCKKYSIDSIGNLKIDTEGHEEFILPSVLAKVKNGFQIDTIKFENQIRLGNYPFLEELTFHFTEYCGYIIKNKTYTDVELVRV